MHVSLMLATVEFGWYVNLWKIAGLILMLMLWARLLTWVDKDALAAHLPRVPLNAGFLCGLIFAFFIFLFLPGFLVAMTVFIVIMLLEMGTYLMLRHQKVGLGDLSKQFKNWIRSFTAKDKEVRVEAGQVMLIDKKGTPYAPPESEDPEFAAYNAVQELLTDPLRRWAEHIEMRPSDGAATVKYTVDGVALDGRSIARDDAAAAVTFLKRLAGMDINDRRKPQTGGMKAQMDGKKNDLTIHTAGSTAGESVGIDVNVKKRFDLTIDKLGLLGDQLNTLEEVIGDGQGIVLLSMPKGHGLTSLLYAVLRRHDAFLSHIQTIERDPPVDLEGITQQKLVAGAAPAEEAKQVSWVASQEPDVLMIDRVDDPRSAADLIKFADQGRRVYIGMRAGNTMDALQQWRTLVGDDKLAMKNLKLIVAGRTARKLCQACKMDYNPDPETLRRLNMPPERVGKLFTARNQPMRDAKGHEVICEFCLELRFRGRLGIYELFVVDDEVRSVVQSGGSVNQLKMLFKKQRQKYLQEVGLAAAVEGETSLQEVARVLRAGEPQQSSHSSSSRRQSGAKS